MASDEDRCYCGHIYDEHNDLGECQVDGCRCITFDKDPDD